MFTTPISKALKLFLGILLVFAYVGFSHANGEAAYQKAQKAYFDGDFAKAAELLKKAVVQGHSAARLPLAGMFRDGEGVSQSYRIAAKLFMISAEEGYPSAQTSLAAMYRMGQGVKRDYEMSIKWYLRAAQQGDAESQNSMGVIYERGRGVKESYMIAHMWYGLAERSGSKRGKYNRKRIERRLKDKQLKASADVFKRCLESKYTDCEAGS